MKDHTFYKLYLLICCATLCACSMPRKLVTDEVVLKDGNTQTGTIQTCDSAGFKLMHMDESITNHKWADIDTIRGKKLQTLWFGANFGLHSAPYFSVFRNEPMVAQNAGAQYKIGMAYRGNKMYYFHLSFIPAKPYAVTKFGLGLQKYIGGTSYIKKNTFFVGGEANLMNVEYNNGPQFTLEPFTGFDKKITERFRVHFKLGFQLNIGNKNSNPGINASIGLQYMRRNFKRYYNELNKEHRLPRK